MMLNMEPYACFKLDCPFRGPYWVHMVASTCAHIYIKLINQPDAGLITIYIITVTIML